MQRIITPLEERIKIPLPDGHSYTADGLRDLAITVKEAVDYINAHHEAIELLESARRLGKLDDLIAIIKGDK